MQSLDTRPIQLTTFFPPQYKADTLKSVQTGQDLKEEHPWVDYTSPSLITLLFTDLGVLTPSAVSGGGRGRDL